MATKHKTRCSTSSVIMKIQIKTMLRCHFTIGMAGIKTTASAGKNLEKLAASYIAGGNKMVQPL